MFLSEIEFLYQNCENSIFFNCIHSVHLVSLKSILILYISVLFRVLSFISLLISSKNVGNISVSICIIDGCICCFSLVWVQNSEFPVSLWLLWLVIILFFQASNATIWISRKHRTWYIYYSIDHLDSICSFRLLLWKNAL